MRALHLVLFALGALLAMPGGSRAEPAEAWQAAQRYTIQARLDAAAHEVHGTLTLRLTNTSIAPLPALYFHLYLNAFRDATSVFMRESGGSLRGDRARGVGSIDLTSLQVGEHDLLASAERELVPGDFSQLRVPLAEPLLPGATTTISATFVAKLPRAFARSGYVGDFHVVAQWFPKLAKLEPDGTFASFPYHGLGEFYADFADYDVTLRTPEGFAVGASGELLSEQNAGKLVERRFLARRVHDMAWVAAPDLAVNKERIGDVSVTFLSPDGFDLALVEHRAVVRRGLAHFGKSFGAYPYPTLTVVVPPRNADGVAGMEYPTLLVTAGNWFATPWAPSVSGAVVTAHELAHQWFYGVLANDELRHPVLDEGLAEWATFDLLRAMYGPKDRLLGPFAPDRFEIARALALGHAASVSPGLAAPAYAEAEYGASVYGRAALALESVRRAYGKARFDAALRRYASDNAFTHPTPHALGVAFDVVYGAGFAKRVLFPLLLAGETSEVRIVEAASEPDGKAFRTTVRARRGGSVSLPTWLCAYDSQGKEIARVAFPEDLSALHASIETSSRVARVAIDPDRALLLDDNVRDQTWLFLAERPTPFLAQLVATAQLLLAWMGP